MKRIVVAALLTGLAFSAQAEPPPAVKAEKPTIGGFLYIYDEGTADEQKWVKKTVGDNANGISWVNSYLEQQGRPLLYCPPANLAIHHAQYFSIFRKYAEQKRKPLEQLVTAIGLVMLRALKDIFPCK